MTRLIQLNCAIAGNMGAAHRRSAARIFKSFLVVGSSLMKQKTPTS